MARRTPTPPNAPSLTTARPPLRRRGITQSTPDLVESLAIVQRLAIRLSGCFDVTSIGDHVVRILTDELGLRSCSIMLVDSTGERIVNLSGASPTRSKTERRSFRLGEGVAGTAALCGKTIRVDDTLDDLRFLKGAGPIRSLLCFPLFSGGRVIGVLNLSHPEPGFFSIEHESVFSILATMVGHLLMFSRLQDELSDFNRSLEAKVEEKTREIEASQRQLFQREKLASLGILVAGVAHELNNRLVPLLAYSHVLAETPRNDEEHRLVSAMASAAVGAKKIVEGLLRFARQDHPDVELMDWNAVIGEAVHALGYQKNHDRLTVRMALDPAIPPVLGDAQQMGQVLINLMNNAVDAMERDGTLDIVSRSGDTHVDIEVADTGPGIPPDVLPKIFDPFFTTKEVGRGTGLGLSLCYGMVRAHRGEIHVESRPGRTVFTVRLPRVTAAQKAPGQPAIERSHV